MEASRFIHLFSDTLQSETPMSLETPLRDIPEWDSMAAMVILTMASHEFNKKISLLDLKKLIAVRDVYELLTH